MKRCSILGAEADAHPPGAAATLPDQIITNAGPDTSEVVERVTEAGELTEQTRELGLSYPAELYPLSHLASAVFGNRFFIRAATRQF